MFRHRYRVSRLGSLKLAGLTRKEICKTVSLHILHVIYHERFLSHLEFCLRSKGFFTGRRHYKT